MCIVFIILLWFFIITIIIIYSAFIIIVITVLLLKTHSTDKRCDFPGCIVTCSERNVRLTILKNKMFVSTEMNGKVETN